MTTPPGSVMRPVSSAVSPSACCAKSGSSRNDPNMAHIAMSMAPSATRNWPEPKTRRSSSARSVRCRCSCRATNAASATEPTTNGTQVGTDDDPCACSPMPTSPYTSPPSPSADSGTDGRSMRWSPWADTLTTRRAPTSSVASAIGATTPKIQRQPRWSRMNPDSVGPSAGATAMTTVMLPIMAPRRATGTIVMTVVMSSGSMTAVPDACTTRASSSTPKPGARKASTVPAVNNDIAATNSVRVVTR